jgi:hypothetical protein
MVTFVLAGVLGSVLAVGEAASEPGQAKMLSSAAGLGVAARVTAEAPARASAPYRRLFSGAADAGATAEPSRLIRFGQKKTPDVVVDAAVDGPCRLVDPSQHKDIDPGIFVPPRDPQIDFKIRRIAPKGCIDPGIFVPKRRK